MEPSGSGQEALIGRYHVTKYVISFKSSFRFRWQGEHLRSDELSGDDIGAKKRERAMDSDKNAKSTDLSRNEHDSLWELHVHEEAFANLKRSLKFVK